MGKIRNRLNKKKFKERNFIFRAMVIFVSLSPQFSMNVHDNLKKTEIAKKLYLIFHSIQHIPHLS